MQEVLSFSSSAESARGQEGILPARHASRAKIDLEKGFKKVLTLLHTENIELRARVTTIEAALAAPKKSVAHASSQTTVDGSTVDANADVLWRLETLEHVVLAKDGPTSDAPRPQRAQGSRSETLDHQRMRKEHQLLRDRFLQLQREVAQQVVQQQLQQVEHLQSQMEQLKLTQEEIQATLELLENSSTSPGRVVLEGVQQQMQRRTEQLQRQLDAAEAVAMESEIHLKALDAPGAAADEKPMSTQDGTRNPALDRIRQDDGYTDRASVSAKAARQALCRVSGSSSATAGADMDAAAQHAAQQWVDVVEQRFTQLNDKLTRLVDYVERVEIDVATNATKPGSSDDLDEVNASVSMLQEVNSNISFLGQRLEAVESAMIDSTQFEKLVGAVSESAAELAELKAESSRLLGQMHELEATKCDASSLNHFAKDFGLVFSQHALGRRGKPLLAKGPPPLSNDASVEEAAAHMGGHIHLVLDRINKELLEMQRSSEQLAAKMNTDLDSLAGHVSILRDQGTLARERLYQVLKGSGTPEERILAVHDSLLEMHDSIMNVKADKSAVARLEKVVSSLVQETLKKEENEGCSSRDPASFRSFKLSLPLMQKGSSSGMLYSQQSKAAVRQCDGRVASAGRSRSAALHERIAVLSTPSQPAEARLAAARSMTIFPAASASPGPSNPQALAAEAFLDNMMRRDVDAAAHGKLHTQTFPYSETSDSGVNDFEARKVAGIDGKFYRSG